MLENIADIRWHIQVVSTLSRLPFSYKAAVHHNDNKATLNYRRLLLGLLRHSIGAYRICRESAITGFVSRMPSCIELLSDNSFSTASPKRPTTRPITPYLPQEAFPALRRQCCCGVVPTMANLKREQCRACTSTGACMNHQTNHRSLHPSPAAR